MVSRGGAVSVAVHAGVAVLVALGAPPAPAPGPVRPPLTGFPLPALPGPVAGSSGQAPPGGPVIAAPPLPPGRVDVSGIPAQPPPIAESPFRCDSACLRRVWRPSSAVTLPAEEVEGAFPELTTPVTPAYPPALRALGRSGRVVVEFTVGSDGVPEPTSMVVVASDDPGFEGSVRAAVARERFTPGRRGGGAVEMRVRQGFDFSVR